MGTNYSMSISSRTDSKWKFPFVLSQKTAANIELQFQNIHFNLMPLTSNKFYYNCSF